MIKKENPTFNSSDIIIANSDRLLPNDSCYFEAIGNIKERIHEDIKNASKNVLHNFTFSNEPIINCLRFGDSEQFYIVYEAYLDNEFDESITDIIADMFSNDEKERVDATEKIKETFIGVSYNVRLLSLYVPFSDECTLNLDDDYRSQEFTLM